MPSIHTFKHIVHMGIERDSNRDRCEHMWVACAAQFGTLFFQLKHEIDWERK